MTEKDQDKTRNLIVDLFRLRTTVADVIEALKTPEACAEFYVSTLPAYGAVLDIWKHVRSMLMVEGKGRSFRTENGKVVALEPTRYEYDLDAIKEVASEVITDEQVSLTPEMEQINKLAQEMFEAVQNAEGAEWVRDYATEFLRLSQPRTVEKVDGRKLAGILGKGDQRAQDLMSKQVKVPVEFKIVVK